MNISDFKNTNLRDFWCSSDSNFKDCQISKSWSFEVIGLCYREVPRIMDFLHPEFRNLSSS